VLRLRNTLTREVEPLATADGERLSMYSCGPTVYRAVHLGNLRTFLLPDLIRRAVEHHGTPVHQVMNITDAGHMTDDMRDAPGEDKMLLAAADEGLTSAEIAAKYEAAFHRDLARLNIRPAAAYPKASDHIGEMIELIERLLERGHAYRDGGTVYYDVSTFEAYGSLSRNTSGHLRPGGHHHHKRNPGDFALWREAGPRRVARYESPWGDGYPGWHIECSAMSLAHLGPDINLHTGGADLVFPHHEAEIAQSEGVLGRSVVRHWVHGGHLLFGTQKMSKSSRNTWTVDDVEDHACHPLDFRYLCLTARYRGQLHFNPEALAGAAKARRRLRQKVSDCGNPAGGPSPRAREWNTRFWDAVGNDLDTPKALTVTWAMVDDAALPDSEKAWLIDQWDNFFGLDLAEAPEKIPLPEGADSLIAQRAKARVERNWAESDRLRTRLADLGVTATDGPEGPTYEVRPKP
jgi:cysteinyl-tRNA synthetase